MWKPLLLDILSSDINPSLSTDVQLGGEVQVCDFNSGDCSTEEKSGSIDASNSLTANSITSSGLIINITLGEDINAGQLVSLTDQGWVLADAATSKLANAIALETALNGESIDILLYGSFKNVSLTLASSASSLYLDDAGDFSANPSSFKQIIGSKLEDDKTIIFNPENTYIEVST